MRIASEGPLSFSRWWAQGITKENGRAAVETFFVRAASREHPASHESSLILTESDPPRAQRRNKLKGSNWQRSRIDGCGTSEPLREVRTRWMTRLRTGLVGLFYLYIMGAESEVSRLLLLLPRERRGNVARKVTYSTRKRLIWNKVACTRESAKIDEMCKTVSNIRKLNPRINSLPATAEPQGKGQTTIRAITYET